MWLSHGQEPLAEALIVSNSTQITSLGVLPKEFLQATVELECSTNRRCNFELGFRELTVCVQGIFVV